jgi:tetratricopeptide (TPR) repeat protein
MFLYYLETSETRSSYCETSPRKDISFKYIIEQSLQIKKEASVLAKENKYEEAISLYLQVLIMFIQAVNLVESVENNDQVNYQKLLANKNECWLNIAICLYHKKLFKESIQFTDKVPFY